MKKLIFLTIATVSSYANISNISYFEANFTQKILDDNNKTIVYKGHVVAAKPQFAFWRYQTPINKKVYISPSEITVIEPDLEQAIIKHISEHFNFFALIKNAKKVDEKSYITHFNNRKYMIKLNNKEEITSISYVDEFDNHVKIVFEDQIENKKYKKEVFMPVIPRDYDIIRN